MTTLGKVTELTRKILFFGGAGIGGLIVLALLVMAGISVKEHFFPTPPPPPTVSFGQISPISFPTGKTAAVTYSVDTVSGFLPVLPDRAKVWQIARPVTGLLSLNRAKSIAAKLSFTQDPQKQTEISYLFTSSSPFNQNLTMSIDSFSFILTSTALDTIPHATIPAISSDVALTTAQTFLTNGEALDSTVDISKTKQDGYIYGTDDKLSRASNIANAQVEYVDFYNADIDKVPFVYPYSPRTNITATVVIIANAPHVVNATALKNIFDPTKFATYPIKTAQMALDDLKNNKGYIVQYDGASKQISIKSISLGYYMPADSYQYVTPVIVFSGDNFLAYVPAITDLWIHSGAHASTFAQ